MPSPSSLSLYTIPSGCPFLKTLALGLLKNTKEDPAHLSHIEIFLPSRRACLELKRAFLRETKGTCLLLPKLHPLGDVDEDEEILRSPQDELSLNPLIPSLQRLGLLANLIEDYTRKANLPSSPELSFKLAKNLVGLMDQAAIEAIPWEGLHALVPEEFAAHWQLTLDFLNIITQHWPLILAEKGKIEPYLRHHRLVELIISRLENAPPSHLFIAAGSTGTMPATQRLLHTIAKLSQGMVILPGLDTSLSASELERLSPCHPQYALARFLEKVGVCPQDVPLWPELEETPPHPRAALFSKALKPSFSLESPPSPSSLENISYLSCASPQEEALSISILMRQHLENPASHIALVTADLRLATRVKQELSRWHIDVDTSFGDPLDQTPPGIFLKLCAEYAAAPEDPIHFLALAKHPLCQFGHAPNKVRQQIYALEKNVLRRKTRPNISSHFSFPPLSHDSSDSTFALVRAHREMAESLATDENGVCQLWKGNLGEALKNFMENLEKASLDFPSLSLIQYPGVFKEMLRGQYFRSMSLTHPRLSILSPIEARLFQADVMILGSLNEGSWPPAIEMDPWLNRPMRQDLGFPPPERRIGLSAHDFAQAFASPNVYLTRALKVDGTPTLACRWVERIETYLKGYNLSLPQESRVLEWAQHLDSPENLIPALPPSPRPPLSVRPRRLSVTQVETWMRDPYALYAQTILSLSPLDPFISEVTAADLGTLMHATLDQFFKDFPDPTSPQAFEGLLSIAETLSKAHEADPFLTLFWRPRFIEFAKWFIEQEKQTRLPGTKTYTEIRGKMTLTTPLGLFECTAKADRIDVLPNGHLRIIDYKTGTPPSTQDVSLGFSPQLPLEGAIALQQGFEGISSTKLESLEFWWIKGDKRGSLVRALPGDPHSLATQALKGLHRMILLFENETTPYPSRPVLSKALRYNDYLHLARLS